MKWYLRAGLRYAKHEEAQNCLAGHALNGVLWNELLAFGSSGSPDIELCFEAQNVEGPLSCAPSD